MHRALGILSNRVKDALKSYDVPEGYEVEMTGEDETINEAMVELFKMLALALLFMYLIMVAQYRLKEPSPTVPPPVSRSVPGIPVQP